MPISEYLYYYNSDLRDTEGRPDRVELKLTTPPAEEPVTVDQVKEWLRIRGVTHHDALINRILQGARQLIENYTGVAFIDQSWTQTHDHPCQEIDLLMSPVKSITSVKYIPNWQSNDQTTLSSSLYVFGDDRLMGTVAWPSHRNWQSFEIEYVAGHGATADAFNTNGESLQLRSALEMLVTHLYNSPGDLSQRLSGALRSQSISTLPPEIISALDNLKVWRI